MNSSKIIILAMCLFSLFSCTKEIDIDVNSSDPQIVVEANLDNENPINIKLTESVNFDDDNIYPAVEGATVVLTDNFGNSETLTEISQGNYIGSSIIGNINSTYTLSILANGKELSSVCTIPNQIPFDSLIVNAASGGPGGGPGGGSSHEVIVEYFDPGNESNYYRFVEYKNDIYVNSFIFDDRLSNGTINKNTLQSFNRTYNSGDVLKVEMQCISKDVYEYYRSFGNLFGGPANASTPANPNTNVQGTKLGYFSAHTIQTKIYIIP